jgi:protein involved in polysaccharide export with SLBB domain
MQAKKSAFPTAIATPNPAWVIGRAVGAVLCLQMVLALVPATAQTPMPSAVPGDAQAERQNPDVPTVAPDSNLSDSTTNRLPKPGASAPGLTAAQIEVVLDEQPEAMVEVKELLADQLQRQGVKIQADAIDDEALYRQIAQSAALRATITNFLHARGYLPSGILASVSSSDREKAAPDVDTDPSLRDGSEALPALPLVLGPDSLTGQEQMGIDGALPLPQQQQAVRGLANQPVPRTGDAQADRAKTLPAATSDRETAAYTTTEAPKVLRQPAPYNLLSMRDLYTQIPDRDVQHLKRFGSEMFTDRGGIDAGRMGSALAVPSQAAPLDIPIGPDYVVGPGDSLSINLWGGVVQTFTHAIDREGRIALPDVGVVQVAGLTLGRAQALIEAALKPQFRNAQVSVTVARLRTVRVYVVGDVQRPGAYDLSSLSSPLSALYAAGGPTAVGSLRTLRHLRGGRVVAEIDLYDFLLHGVRADDRFEGGDTLLVPPAGPQVAVSGAVKRPAIYELKQELRGGSSLADVLSDAGGASVAASLAHIAVERIDANRRRETVTVELPEGATAEQAQASIAAFAVKDGDRVRVSEVAPFSQRAVYLEGHVVRPGRLAYRDGMELKDVLQSYQDLLPEPAARGEIVRLVAPDLHAETIEFDLGDALIGNVQIALQPFDTIRVLGRYEVDAPRVTVRGEVLRPGAYPLSAGMTAAQLVRMAGGFKRDALQQDADLTSYRIVDGGKVAGQRSAVRIGDAMTGDRNADVALKPGDILTIHQITGWDDIGNSATLEGEVNHPGSYGFQEGERLSSVLRRAGGFRDTAYPDGAVLIRKQVRDLEEKSRAELIHQIETTSAAARLAPNLANSDQTATLQLIQQQQDQVLARLRSQPATGRLVIHISADIDSWANTDADIEVRQGDVLTVPKRPGFVLVSGQVYNASALTFVPGKPASWYLERAGGSSEFASRKEIFIIRANGSVVGRRSGAWYDSHVLSTRLEAGDVVVVPQKIVGASQFWRNLLTVAQIASSAAITAVVAGL